MTSEPAPVGRGEGVSLLRSVALVTKKAMPLRAWPHTVGRQIVIRGLGPAGAWRRCLDGEHLARTAAVIDSLSPQRGRGPGWG